MSSIRRENIISNATFNATVTSSAFINDGRTVWSVVTKVGTMTTTPTLTVSVYVSMDGTTWVLAGTGTAINASNGTNRITFGPGGSGTNPNFQAIVEPYIQVVAAFGGSGSFANTYCDLVGTSFGL